MNPAFRAAFVATCLAGALLSGGCPRCADCASGGDGTANVQLTSLSGRFGYELAGPYSFAGTLTKDRLTDQAWRLEAAFSFPTGGYAVGTPVILVTRSYPEQVSITIPVTPPEPGSIVAQVITVVPVTADITASNQARFRIRFTGTGTLDCPDAVQAVLKNEKDAWTLEAGTTAPRLVIDCPSGIGEAALQFSTDCPLAGLLVALRYAPGQPFARLEGFEAVNENGGKWSGLGACFCRGFAQVELPADALDPANGVLTIRWVDVYR